MNPFFRPHDVIPKQAKMKQLAQLLMKPQLPSMKSPPALQSEVSILTAKKKRPLAGTGIEGPNKSLPQGDASGI